MNKNAERAAPTPRPPRGSGAPAAPAGRPAPPAKARRQDLILRLCAAREIASQEDLQRALRAEGMRATQATLSRDIHELGLVKIGGFWRPAPPAASIPAPPEAFDSALRRFVLEVAASGNMVVLRTRPGSAHAVGVELDRVRFEELVGDVAGDDTILAVARSPRSARAVVRRLREILG